MRPEGTFIDLQRPREVFAGGLRIALLLIYGAKMSEAARDVGVVRSQGALSDGRGTLEFGPGGVSPALEAKRDAQIRADAGHQRVIGPARHFRRG